MKSLRARLTPKADAEAGLTLIEVIIAMMIFAMVAVGVAYAVSASLVTTRDAKAREVAANLAAQDIDYARSVDDVTAVVNQTTSTTVNGITYTLKRTTGWISSDGADSTCGSSSGVLLYKHVNDRVTWTGARTSTTTVQADTLIAPAGRINDPDLGTILVNVQSATGVGSAGVTIKAIPLASNPAGAVALTTTPAVTDNQGCSYILKVVPGNYQVSLSKTGYVSDTQSAAPITTVLVKAGTSTGANFQFDKSSTFTAHYASDSAATVTATPVAFPSNLEVNYVSSNATYAQPVTVPAAKTATNQLFPLISGYSAYTDNAPSSTATQPSCISRIPSTWKANAAGIAGQSGLAAAAVPGGSVDIYVPMGIFTATATTGTYLTAVPATAAASVGDPGCSSTTALTFNAKTTTGTTVLALPFGTWTLYSGSTAGAKSTAIATAAIALPAGSPTNTAAGVFTLDPRVIMVQQ